MTTMDIAWDIDVPMDDGITLKANVFRPPAGGPFPALLSYGPYAKDLPFQDAYPLRWRILEQDYPDALEGSSNAYQAWEVVDPEIWVPWGYAVVRVDSRGAGRSPGVLDNWSSRESTDLAQCIEWVAAQPWSNGRVGLAGVSYYAMLAWRVAAMQPPPPHLAAIACWEGASDLYREGSYHGGIYSSFLSDWFDRVKGLQHGSGRATRNPVSGLSVTGDVTLSPEELERNRRELGVDIRAHPLLDSYWESRAVDLSSIGVPVLSAGNWGGHGLHLRGNVEGFLQSPPQSSWLEIHGREHWTLFYAPYGQALQRRFFDYFLRDEGDWKHAQPRIQLQIRNPDDTFVTRGENEWPLARTQWERFFLDVESMSLGPSEPPRASNVAYNPLEGRLLFAAAPFTDDVEITGPVAAKLWISSETTDADLFLVLHAYHPDGSEVLLRGAADPFVPMAQGWLRASHRRLDRARTQPWRPVHRHTEVDTLVPGRVYEVDVELWPTCLVLPAGFWIALSVLGRDYDHGLTEEQMTASGRLSYRRPSTRGSGPYHHEDPVLRPHSTFGGNVTVYTGGDHGSHVLLPFIPRVS